MKSMYDMVVLVKELQANGCKLRYFLLFYFSFSEKEKCFLKWSNAESTKIVPMFTKNNRAITLDL